MITEVFRQNSNQKTKKINRKTLNLASLYEISNVIGASYDLKKLLNIILATMLKQTNADSGSLMLLDDKRQELYIGAYRGLSARIAKKARIKVGQVVAGIVAQTKKPLLIHNKNFESIFGKKPRKKIRSSLCIPLSVSDKLIGVMNLNRIPGSEDFNKHDLEAISVFAIESSIAIYNAKLYIEAEQKIQHLFRFNVISCALNSALTQEKITDVLTDCMCELFPFDIYTLLLIKEKNYFLLICTQAKLDQSTIEHLKKNLAMVISSLQRENIPHKKIKIAIKKLHISAERTSNKIFPKNINSVINAPVITKGNTLGMLSMYSTQKDGFDQKDQQSLTTLANQTAVALENSNLYKSLRKTYLSTIKALAQAIEEKDVYTRGHSDMVSNYAVAIAQAMQLSSKFIEGIQIAGILHDIGKIGIPEKILSKPGTLTVAEYEIIKNHPKIGKRILEPVNFFLGDINIIESANKTIKKKTKKILLDKKFLKRISYPLQTTIDFLKTTDLSNEIKTMIYHHHEKYGGGGYPSGIKGQAIPLGSRILAVADTFEAMTAKRPYRQAFPLKKALRLLKNCTPGQLDPDVVDVFIKLIKRKIVKVKKG